LTALIPRAIKLHFGDRGARSIGNEAVTVCVDANENAAFVDFVDARFRWFQRAGSEYFHSSDLLS